jgi:methionyl-tRNA formyltransferase
MSQSVKFAYFGTPSVAASTLERLIEAGYVPAVVVTAPDAPRGRGLVLTPSEVRAAAAAHGIPVVTPDTLDREAIVAIREYGAELAVVVAYGKIFPQTLIESFPKGAINVHYSLLPKYRGATPMEAALLAGDTETGVTVQQMALELDAGDILAQEAVLIAATETAHELRPRLILMGARMLVELLPRLAAGEVTPVPQDHALATRAHKFKKKDGELNLDAPGEENWRKYRAYADTIGTYFFKDGMRYKIAKASLEAGRFVVERVIPEGKNEREWQA